MQTKFLSVLALSALLFTACSNDNDDATDNWNGEIRLSTVSTDLTARSAPDDQIAKSQKIGLYISEDATPATITYTQNLAYTADGSGKLSGTTQYYPETGNGVKISAYHPYNSADANIYDFSVAANQSNNTDYYNSDLLYSAEKSYARKKTTWALSFDHLLSKITYSLEAGVGNPNLTDAKVKIMNTLPTAEFNRTTGALSAATGTAPIDIIPNGKAAIIIPQTMAEGAKLIEVELASGGKLYYTVTAGNIDFEAGKVYNYTITVNLTTITVTSNVTPWEPIVRTGNAVMD